MFFALVDCWARVANLRVLVPEINGQTHRRGGQNPRNDEEAEMRIRSSPDYISGIASTLSHVFTLPINHACRRVCGSIDRDTRGPLTRTVNYLYPVAIMYNTVRVDH